jgi:glycerol-3-phosphate dehydrogenase
MSQYDVIIIGGGVNGSGIARDCTMRGLKTLLIEKNDFGAGTSGASSCMIHGGARYMLHDTATTKKSCLDSGYIQKIAPHLIFRIPFIIPVLKSRKNSTTYLNGLDLYFEAYDSFAHLKGGKPHTRLSAEQALRIEPGLNREIIGAVTMDEWGIDANRLCLLNALSAQQHGAEIKNHTEVIDFLVVNNAVRGVKAKDKQNGEIKEFFGKIIVNAAGPWITRLSKKANTEVRIRPGKGVHLFLDRRFSNFGVISEAIDGRQIFIIPHESTSMLGTTDDDFYGDPDAQFVTEDEVEYLLEGIERVLPGIRGYRFITTTSGIRITLYEWGKYEDDLSRDHRIFDHEKIEGIKNIISIAGGKLASFRLMSEEAADLVCNKLKVNAKCRTHLEPLPGGEQLPDPSDISRKYNLPFAVARKLISRYGSKIERLMDYANHLDGGKNLLCICSTVLKAEIIYAVHEEMARDLPDIMRRTKLGNGACQGMRCIQRAIWLLGRELNLNIDEMEAMMDAFLDERWKWRAPVAKYSQLPQEELNTHAFYANTELRKLNNERI